MGNFFLDIHPQKEWRFIDETEKSYIPKTLIDFGVYNNNRQFRNIGSYKMVNCELVRPLKAEKELDDIKDVYITFINGREKQIKLDDCDFFHCTQKHIWNKEVLQKDMRYARNRNYSRCLRHK